MELKTSYPHLSNRFWVLSLATLLCIAAGTWTFAFIGWPIVLNVALAAIWTIGPPLWFLIEYAYVFPKYGGEDVSAEDFRHGQQLSAALWAGVLAMLGLIYATKGFAQLSVAQ